MHYIGISIIIVLSEFLTNEIMNAVDVKQNRDCIEGKYREKTRQNDNMKNLEGRRGSNVIFKTLA